MTHTAAIDGTNLTHRAWHATSNNPEATITLVHRWIRDVTASSTHAIIAFDGANAGAWRYRILPAYKSGRSTKAPELTTALTNLPQHLRNHGWAVETPDDLEADDICAHHATQARPGHTVAVVTGDKDAYALARENLVTIVRPAPSGWQTLTASDIHERTGIRPERYNFYNAIKGDPSDKIPGVRGLGTVAATKLATAFTDADAWIADLENGGTGTQAALGVKPAARLLARRDEVIAELTTSAHVIEPKTDIHSIAGGIGT